MQILVHICIILIQICSDNCLYHFLDTDILKYFFVPRYPDNQISSVIWWTSSGHLGDILGMSLLLGILLDIFGDILRISQGYRGYLGDIFGIWDTLGIWDKTWGYLGDVLGMPPLGMGVGVGDSAYMIYHQQHGLSAEKYTRIFVNLKINTKVTLCSTDCLHFNLLNASNQISFEVWRGGFLKPMVDWGGVVSVAEK